MVHHHPEDEHEVLSLKKVLASTLSAKVVVGHTILHSRCEPRHDKTNTVTVRPAKTQISLGIRPVRSGSSLSA